VSEGRPGPEEPEGRLRPTTPSEIGGSALTGLVLGWLIHPITGHFGTAPVITWLPAVTLFFVAAVLGATSWITWRTVHVRRQWLEPHRAVNRLVLAKSCVLVGGLVGGGYLGYALSWVGDRAELAGDRILHSVAAGLGGVAIAVFALLLERACRVRSDDDAE
jgi:hypothetical protein